MSRYSRTLAEVFDAYGGEAAEALAAYANLDPEGWSDYVDAAAEKQYRADYGNHRRSQVRLAEKDAVAQATGQVRLFEPEESGGEIALRTRMVLDGKEVALADLAGHGGASDLRKIAERDLTPALTTVNRCRYSLRLADHMDVETERLGRDVTAAEVLGWAKAS